MHFAFIDGTKSDKSTRRLARSHAMKGKNVGKTHPRRPRPGMGGSCTRDEAALGKIRGSSTALVQGTLSLHPTAWVGDELVSASFLTEARPQSLVVIKQRFAIIFEALYPPRICRSLDRVQSQWMQMMFADQTSYHCSLAVMAAMNDFFYGREVASPKAMAHLGQAISLVKRSLETAEALSNSNISVVNFLIVQGLVREERTKAEVHLKGLQRMIELRGGLSQLEEDSMLVLKLCKTDVDFSLHYGTSTCFYRDRMPKVALELASEGFIMRSDSCDSGSRFSGVHPFLREILLDANGISSLFNSGYSGFRIDPDMLQEVVVSVGYRLVRFQRLAGPPPPKKCESAYHIGLAAFMATLFLQSGQRRFLKYGLIAQCIKDVIQRGLDQDDEDLMLWLLFIGGVSVLPGPDKAWLVPRISQALRSLGIVSWSGVQDCLVRFAWIKSLHDEAARELWDLAMAHGPI